MPLSRDKAIDQAIARDQIRDLLSRYSQGIDRCDVARLKGVFWPDGHCDYASFVGNAWEFADMVIGALRTMTRTQHIIGNMVIELDGEDRARGETYIVAYHELEEDGAPAIKIVGGRYLDRFERRDGEWRIAHRHYLVDWNQNPASSQDWQGWIYGLLTNRGGHFPNDAAFAWYGAKEPA